MLQSHTHIHTHTYTHTYTRVPVHGAEGSWHTTSATQTDIHEENLEAAFHLPLASRKTRSLSPNLLMTVWIMREGRKHRGEGGRRRGGEGWWVQWLAGVSSHCEA